MSWQSKYTLVFRGHDTTDSPTATGYVEANVAVMHAIARRTAIGAASDYGGGVIRGARGRRWEIECVCDGFATNQDVESETQDYGDYLRLDTVLSMRYVYLYRAWRSYGSPSLGAIPRTREHDINAAPPEDTFWWSSVATTDTYPSSPGGMLPLAIELRDSLALQPATGGVSDLSFTVAGRYAIS